MTLENISQAKVFGGWHKQYSFESNTLKGRTRFAIFLPPNATQANPVPVLYWLSGLTCTDENFMQKAGAFHMAAELGVAIVAPDTSPRGDKVADDDNYDLGQGAGFYLNATEMPWAEHYQMYDFITQELPALIEQNFPVTDVKSISGHSMGGHGALTIGLKNPHQYRSISAFSPISNPVNCPWGQKAFSAYLGADKTRWAPYDASELLKQASEILPILIEQGEADQFLNEQLMPEAIIKVAKAQNLPVTVRMQPGYDHSYFFIATFIELHLKWHSNYLKSL